VLIFCQPEPSADLFEVGLGTVECWITPSPSFRVQSDVTFEREIIFSFFSRFQWKEKKKLNDGTLGHLAPPSSYFLSKKLLPPEKKKKKKKNIH
jgi:hypothetical protein